MCRRLSIVRARQTPCQFCGEPHLYLAENVWATSPTKNNSRIAEVDRSVVSRLLGKRINPTLRHLSKLEAEFKIEKHMWREPHEKFVEHYYNSSHVPPEQNPTEPVRRLDLATIKYYSGMWRECFNIHRGQYIAYWNGPSKGEYMAALLEIHDRNESGIKWQLINPYDNTTRRAWIYDGIMYPVGANYLHFTGEHREGGRFEILNMITTASLGRPPDMIYGCMMGIYVVDGRSRIAV